MVLRDERDRGKKEPRQLRWDDGIWRKNRRIHRMYSKKMRVKTKKNMNSVVVFNSKQKHIKKEKIKSKKDMCIICCEVSKKIKYINCKRGGVQNVKFGRYGECCKDKPICKGCRIKCAEKCPFCNDHTLHRVISQFPQKKPSFAVRQERIRIKKLKKLKKLKNLKNAEMFREPVERWMINVNRFAFIHQ